jgi:hypothetical protein
MRLANGCYLEKLQKKKWIFTVEVTMISHTMHIPLDAGCEDGAMRKPNK